MVKTRSQIKQLEVIQARDKQKKLHKHRTKTTVNGKPLTLKQWSRGMGEVYKKEDTMKKWLSPEDWDLGSRWASVEAYKL